MNRFKEYKVKFSQNFLFDKKLVNELVNLSNINSNDIVLEIGTGKGIITKYLMNSCKKLLTYEIDNKLFNNLLEMSFNKNVELINCDFLQCDLPENGTEYKVFSSIPFNITSSIINKLLFNNNPPTDTYLIVQKEVAYRYAGLNKECLQSLLLKPNYEIKVKYLINKENFRPIPNVDCALIYFQKKDVCDVKDYKSYCEFIKYIFTTGFKSKKKLFNLFSYTQSKIIMRKLNIKRDFLISEIKYDKWLELFNYYESLKR